MKKHLRLMPFIVYNLYIMIKRIVILTCARSGASRLKQLFFRSFLGFPKLDTELFKTNNPSLKNFLIKNKHNLLPGTAHKYKKVLEIVKPYLVNNCEITIEANPNSASRKWLEEPLSRIFC